jgi:hypothetical protein
MSGPRSESKLQEHPFLGQLLEHNAVPYRGYVGPRSERGRVTLYLSLGDLSFYVEIDEDDIVASSPCPERLMPHGGTVVWVKQDAEVVAHGQRVNVYPARMPQIPAVRRLLTADPVGGAGAAEPPMVQVETGRLNIRLRQRARSTCASCHCSSCQTHPTCTCELQDQQPVVVIAD